MNLANGAMFGVSLRSVRYRWPLFVGAFIALSLGTLLLGVTALGLGATSQAQPNDLGPTIRITDAGGVTQVIGRDALDMGGIQTVLALAGVVSGFITIFVIASSFAFGVALRRRDIGLLRLIGASRRQMRSMILGEALVVAIPAGLVGCLIAWLLAPFALEALNNTPLSPLPLRMPDARLPLAICFLAGLPVALLGAWTASGRAGKIPPVQALSEAAIDKKVMTPARWLIGIPLLAGGVLLLALTPGAGEFSTPLVIFGSIATTIAVSFLGPIYIPRLAKVVAAPTIWFSRVSGRLAASGLAVAKRRTSSLVAPIIAIVTIVGTLTMALASTGASITSNQLAHLRSQIIAVPAQGGAFTAQTLDGLRNEPTVAAVYAPASAPVVVVPAEGSFDRQEAVVADLPDLAAAMQVHTTSGELKPLAADHIAISAEFASWHNLQLNSELQLNFFDGREVKAKIQAILDAGASTPQIVMNRPLAGEQITPPTTAYVRLHSNSNVAASAETLRYASDDQEVQAVPTNEWISSNKNEQQRLNNLVLLVLVGPASAYALIAIANTLVMAYSQRTREFAGMRVVGMHRRELHWIVIWESLAVVVLSTILAAGIIASASVLFQGALQQQYGTGHIAIAWIALVPLVGACLATALVTSLMALRQQLRTPAIQQLAARQ